MRAGVPRNIISAKMQHETSADIFSGLILCQACEALQCAPKICAQQSQCPTRIGLAFPECGLLAKTTGSFAQYNELMRQIMRNPALGQGNRLLMRG